MQCNLMRIFFSIWPHFDFSLYCRLSFLLSLLLSLFFSLPLPLFISLSHSRSLYLSPSIHPLLSLALPLLSHSSPSLPPTLSRSLALSLCLFSLPLLHSHFHSLHFNFPLSSFLMDALWLSLLFQYRSLSLSTTRVIGAEWMNISTSTHQQLDSALEQCLTVNASRNELFMVGIHGFNRQLSDCGHLRKGSPSVWMNYIQLFLIIAYYSAVFLHFPAGSTAGSTHFFHLRTFLLWPMAVGILLVCNFHKIYWSFLTTKKASPVACKREWMYVYRQKHLASCHRIKQLLKLKRPQKAHNFSQVFDCPSQCQLLSRSPTTTKTIWCPFQSDDEKKSCPFEHTIYWIY